MPGLDPGIHVSFPASCRSVDGRVKPGHDEERVCAKRDSSILCILRASMRAHHTALKITFSPSRGFGIGHTCQLGW